MNEEEYFEQLCSNSVDGTLTDSEKRRLEEHLAECPSCAALKEDLEQMRSLLTVEEQPPAGLHDSIMERLRQEDTLRVVAPQKPMRRMPVMTMVAAAAVVVLVVLGGGLMPAFSTVGSSGSAAADAASADAGDCTADGGMQESVQQAAEENGTADSTSSGSSDVQSRSADTGADSGVAEYAESAGADADTPSEAQTAVEDNGTAVQSVSEPEIAVQAQNDSGAKTAVSLPQSLHGLHAAHCYMAISGSDLPDIGGELLAQEDGVSWFLLENNMDTLQKTLQTAEQAGYTVSAYDDVGLTIDSRADSWVLAVVTG